jgi:hypothetical protein
MMTTTTPSYPPLCESEDFLSLSLQPGGEGSAEELRGEDQGGGSLGQASADGGSGSRGRRGRLVEHLQRRVKHQRRVRRLVDRYLRSGGWGWGWGWGDEMMMMMMMMMITMRMMMMMMMMMMMVVAYRQGLQGEVAAVGERGHVHGGRLGKGEGQASDSVMA